MVKLKEKIKGEATRFSVPTQSLLTAVGKPVKSPELNPSQPRHVFFFLYRKLKILSVFFVFVFVFHVLFSICYFVYYFELSLICTGEEGEARRTDYCIAEAGFSVWQGGENLLEESRVFV